MLWYQRRKKIYGTERAFFGTGLPTFGMDRPTETVFGEAKSFGRRGEDVFNQDDVDKMKLLAEAFPGSILVFAAMKEKLSPSEIDRIKELAEWGREYDKERRPRAPVIVLTGTIVYNRLINYFMEKNDGLGTDITRHILANFTQHLYLDLEMLPYGPTMAQGEKLDSTKRINCGLEL